MWKTENQSRVTRETSVNQKTQMISSFAFVVFHIFKTGFVFDLVSPLTFSVVGQTVRSEAVTERSLKNTPINFSLVVVQLFTKN